ncbi:MAG TPA: hypothetical protein VLG47_04600 [Candidatus Saccharimonadales bacterium]|nr:hypothetical protein [Candidatus Saccharimonadales bacterium]
MKRAIDGRSVLVYTIIIIVGLLLLCLILPNIVPLPFMLVAFSLVPLLVAATILFFIFGSSKRSDRPESRKLTRYLADLAVFSTAASVFFTYISTEQPPYGPGTLRYVFENIGVACLFAGVACVLLVITRQKFVYWPFWNTKDRQKSDERQKTVRNRVYEKSYRTILLLLIASWLVNVSPSTQRLHDELIQVAILCVLGLPSVIAAWQVDS